MWREKKESLISSHILNITTSQKSITENGNRLLLVCTDTKLSSVAHI